MLIRKVVRAWLVGWYDLISYGSVSGYEACGWLERKCLDHAALWALFRSTRFRRVVLLLIAVQLLVLSLAWRWDLDGWRRDIFRAAPALLVLPWFMTARKGAIKSILQQQDL
jgi:hypothetical protein